MCSKGMVKKSTMFRWCERNGGGGDRTRSAFLRERESKLEAIDE